MFRPNGAFIKLQSVERFAPCSSETCSEVPEGKNLGVMSTAAKEADVEKQAQRLQGEFSQMVGIQREVSSTPSGR